MFVGLCYQSGYLDGVGVPGFTKDRRRGESEADSLVDAFFKSTRIEDSMQKRNCVDESSDWPKLFDLNAGVRTVDSTLRSPEIAPVLC